MYRSILISPDAELGSKLRAALEASGHVEIARALDHYPTGVELIRTVRALAADILFIDFGSMAKGLEILHLLETEGSPLQIVGLAVSWIRQCCARPCARGSANSWRSRSKRGR